METGRLVGALATLAMVALAFSFILGGTRGPAILGRALCHVLARTLRIAAGLFFTALDAIPTLAIMVYHAANPLTVQRVPDDVAAFASRLVDRSFRTLVP